MNFKDYLNSLMSLTEIKLKKVKKYKPDEKGNYKKVLVKMCVDDDGNRVDGYKIDGKSCTKISGSEAQELKKRQRKIDKTKARNKAKIENRAKLLAKKRKSKGLD